MNEEIPEYSHSIPGNTDICFQGINFAGALVALAAAHSGLRVAINPGKLSDYPFTLELVPVYPLNVFQIAGAKASVRMLEKIASLYPSHIYPQRLLTLCKGKKFTARTLSFSDFLLHRDQDEASLPIRFSNFTQYNSLEGHFFNGALIPEFRFDRNMALLSLLLRCRQSGVCFVKRDETISAKVNVMCHEPVKHELIVDKEFLAFGNNVRIIDRRFEVHTQQLGDKVIVRFHLLEVGNHEEFVSEAIQTLKILGVVSAEAYREQLSLFLGSGTHKNKPFGDELFLEDASVQLLRKTCLDLSRKITRACGKKVRFTEWLNTHEPITLTGEHFRSVQSVCDEKFDLAKQTGIDYHDFSYYFFRYSDSIDDFIEQAFNAVQDFRGDPRKVWTDVEERYLQKIENMLFEK